MGKTKTRIETHGQVEEPVKQKFQPTLLEQVWGADNQARYGTDEEEVYFKQVTEMTRSDLEAHARKMGVVIVEHTPRLRDKLMQEFASYVSFSRKPASSMSLGPLKITDEAKKVLQEGR